MEHFGHLSYQEKEDVFIKRPGQFNKYTARETLAYALGATLYIPAIHEKLYDYLRARKYKALTTLVICLEDGIADHEVEKAEEALCAVFKRLSEDLKGGSLKEEELPLLFIRVRSYEQLGWILKQEAVTQLITGFTLPKFNSQTGEDFLSLIEETNKEKGIKLYGMPILESIHIIALETQVEELMALQRIIRKYKEIVLNVRIGATDFTGLFGIRRSIDATIYDVAVIKNCIANIVNTFGRAEDAMVISGPVWEYFSGNGRLLKPELRQTPFRRHGYEGAQIRRDIVSKAEDGLIKEIILDKVNGLTGKTIIHPSHIRYVNALQAVTYEEYEDACQILSVTESGVVKSSKANKMNEIKPHTNWAKKILMRAEIYGVISDHEDYTALF